MVLVRNTRSAVAANTQNLVTGFHAVEEKIRYLLESKKHNTADYTLYYANPGPRVKKILSLAKDAGVNCVSTDKKSLDSMTQSLSELARDHRGLVLKLPGSSLPAAKNILDLAQWISAEGKKPGRKLVIVLDSVTDPHNVGAIIRSADQFGAALVIIPNRRSASDVASNEVIARASAGASAWHPVAITANLVRAVQDLKEAGFWIYGADAGGESVQNLNFAEKSVIVMGSEGSGISRLLTEQCDTIASIPTCGKIDSLNVSVAAGVLMYEFYRQSKES